MDALPIEVREALECLPVIKTPGQALHEASYISSAGGALLAYVLRDDDDSSRDKAARLAAASIRLVEYLNQEWP